MKIELDLILESKFAPLFKLHKFTVYARKCPQRMGSHLKPVKWY